MDGSSNPYAVVQGRSFAAPLLDFTSWQNKQPQQKPPGAPPVGPNAPPGAPMNLAPGAQPAPQPQGGQQQFAALLQKLFGNIGQGGGAPNGGAPPMRNDINGRPIGGPQAMVGPNGPQGLY